MAKFKIDGKEYEFDDSSILVSEARLIKKHAQMGMKSFSEGLADGDPDAIVGMVFLAKRRAGEEPRWADFDEFNLASVEQIPEDADAKDEDEAEEVAGEVPPTGPAETRSSRGTTRKAASAAT